MKDYIIVFAFYKPYPRQTKELRVSATSLGVALRKAYRLFRHNYRGLRLPKEVTIKSIRL